MITVRPLASCVFAMVLLIGLCERVPAAPDLSRWQCTSCPFASGTSGEYQAGATYVSDDAFRFGNASGLDKQGLYLLAAGRFRDDDGALRARVSADDLGLESRRLSLQAVRPGRFELGASYHELPGRRYGSTETVFEQISISGLVLPADWARAPLTSGMTALADSLVPATIGGERQRFDVEGRYRVGERLSLFGSYHNEQRDGRRLGAGTFFTQSVQLAQPFDYRTDGFGAGLKIRNRRGHVELRLRQTQFDSRAQSLTWDNPFTSSSGADRGRIAQPPDNRLREISVAGLVTGPGSAILSLTAAKGWLTQSDQLLDYTLNASLPVVALPRQSLDGEVDTTNLAVRIASRPTPQTRLTFGWRLDDRDNDSPRSLWTRTIADSFVAGEAEQNAPYSLRRVHFSGRADTRLHKSLRVSAGLSRVKTSRDLQEVGEQTEDGGWASLAYRLRPGFEIGARAGGSRRKIDQYDAERAADFGQNPLLRKYNLAARSRKYSELTVSARVPDTSVDVVGSASLADDDYSESVMGLLGGNEWRYALDVSWAVSARLSTSVHASRQRIEATQAGSEFFAQPDWQGRFDDEFLSFAFGVQRSSLTERIDLKMDYTLGYGEGDVVVTSAAGGRSRFPELTTRLHSVRIESAYRYSQQTQLLAQVRFESFRTSDWALTGVAPATLAAVLGAGADPYDYNVLTAGFSFRYRFGER